MKNIFKRAAVFAAALGMALTSFSCAGKILQPMNPVTEIL